MSNATFMPDEDEDEAATVVLDRLPPPASAVLPRADNSPSEPPNADDRPTVFDPACVPDPPKPWTRRALAGIRRAFSIARSFLVQGITACEAPTFTDLMPPIAQLGSSEDTKVSTGVCQPLTGEAICLAFFRLSHEWLNAVRLVSAYAYVLNQKSPEERVQGYAHYVLSRMRPRPDGSIHVRDVRAMMREVRTIDFERALLGLEIDKVIELLPPDGDDVASQADALCVADRGYLGRIKALVKL